MKIATMLLIGLALAGGGCASPGPSAAQVPAGQARDERLDTGLLWYAGYWVMYFAGEGLAGR